MLLSLCQRTQNGYTLKPSVVKDSQIIAYLRHCPGQSVRDIARALGTTNEHMKHRVPQLLEKGQIAQLKRVDERGARLYCFPHAPMHCEELIVAYLTEHQEATTRDFADALELGKEYAARVLKMLMEKGVVARRVLDEGRTAYMYSLHVPGQTDGTDAE